MIVNAGVRHLATTGMAPHGVLQGEVDLEEIGAALAAKADTLTVNAALALKADTSTVNTANFLPRRTPRR